MHGISILRPLSRLWTRLAAAASSLRARILLVFSALTILPVVVVGVVSYSVALATVREQTFESSAEVAGQLAVNIGLRMGDAEKMLKISDSEAIVRFVNPWRQDEERTYRSALEILRTFALLRGTYEFADIVKGVHILGFNGNAMSELSGRYIPRVDPRMSVAVRAALDEPGEVAFVSSDAADFAPEGPAARDVVSVSRAIVRIATHDILGAVVVNVDRAELRRLCAAAKLGDTGGFSLLAKDGAYVYPQGGPEPTSALPPERLSEILSKERGRFVSSAGGEPQLYVYDTIPAVGWKILGRVRLSELGSAAGKIERITFSAIAATVALMVVLYLFITKALTRPLRSLESVIARAEAGDLEARAGTLGTGEVARLGHAYDAMMDRLGQLIGEVVREHEELNKMELKALQAQINPHFLYNTLDAIVWMAEAGKKEEIVQMAKNLSSFFRLSLSRGEDWISVEEEVTHVESYLAIQKARYRDILDYAIEVEPAARGARVLKLTLQPLVENAIYHGIKNKRSGGVVSVRIRRDTSGFLVLRVEDDGAGICPERLAALRRAVDGGAASSDAARGDSGYGLRNVRRRLELYYGPLARLSIESREGEGTAATATLPEPVHR